MASAQLENLLKHLYALMPVQGTETLSDAELLRRFTTRGEEVAFAALVRRHGPLVLQVCQRLLHDPNTAEDVFQAAFLVLARKANSLRKPEAVGSFLYGVAYRLARRARVEAIRQQVHEKLHLVPPSIDPLAEVSGRELLALLEDELNRLPTKYRLPLVLCCLQGRTGDEAAEQLGLALRTLQRRLEQGRALLHARLTRRGLAPSLPLLGMFLAPPASSALPIRLLTPTVRAALAFTARSAGLAGLRSARAVALAEGILRTMFVTKLQIATSLMLPLTLLTAGMYAVAARTEPVPQAVVPMPPAHPRPAAPTPPAPPAVPEEAKRVIKTDDAIAAGLQWLVRQQQRDGHWNLGFKHRNGIAATAFALLPLLAAGETPKNTDALHPYGRVVERGLRFLVGKQDAAGFFGGPDMYSHALATRAMCEAYGVTTDPALKAPAQRAIDAIVAAQDKQGGGWRYAPGQAGDTSVTSYQVLALVAARRAGLIVPKETLTRTGKYLDSAATQDGSGYSYTPGGTATPTMTAAGHLCRLVLGGRKDDKALIQWAAKLDKETLLGAKSDLYYCHYLTQTLQHRGGADWDLCEVKIRTYLLDKQDRGEKQRGSWPAIGQTMTSIDGRLMPTSLALLTLQECARTDKLPALPARELKAPELAKLYDTLSDKDFVEARRALRTLTSSPHYSVPYLRTVLRPVPPIDRPQIERWIADLDADEFAVRERAVSALEKQGELAHSALGKALANKPTVEVRRRIEQLMEATQSAEGTPEQRQALRAIGVLERIGTADARKVLASLAKGAAEARLTQEAKASLERLDKNR